jgi:uncharacterized membrane protein (DUF485 family)
MSHGPATQWGKDHAASIKSKLGMTMFFIYTLIYAGFIFINVTYPKWMKIDIGSMNLAIIYGIGLIIIALIQAVIYNHYCTKSEKELEKEAKNSESGEAE